MNRKARATQVQNNTTAVLISLKRVIVNIDARIERCPSHADGELSSPSSADWKFGYDHFEWDCVGHLYYLHSRLPNALCFKHSESAADGESSSRNLKTASGTVQEQTLINPQFPFLALQGRSCVIIGQSLGCHACRIWNGPSFFPFPSSHTTHRIET